MNRRNFIGALLKGSLVSFSSHASRAMARKSKPLELEIIASSTEDAVAAFEGGASRLEVTVRLDEGGLTPPLKMVEDILRHVPIPARAMLRENSGFELSGPEELEKLQAGARALAKLRIDRAHHGVCEIG